MINKNELSKSAISSINLGIENPDAYFLSDDDTVRLYAINIGLNVIGTTRVFADATVKGKIKTIKELTGILYQLKADNYPITDEMIADIVTVVENRIKMKEQSN
jgi:predicted nucleic acid-binding protein